MTVAHVRSRLDELLKFGTPRVLMLFGDWGTGKTYQWQQALKRAKPAPSFAYVSAFGIASLADLRRRIVEESVLAVSLPENGKVADIVGTLDGKLRPTHLLKLLPLLPYVGKLDGIANELAFAAVRKKVICIDDVERAPGSLAVSDVLGLANYLKEERECSVLLISNRGRLKEIGKTELKLYLEKVVDEWIDMEPTVEEAADIAVALSTSTTPALKMLRDRVVRLKVTNIRVIKQLARMAAELEELFKGLHPGVLSDAVAALALFGASHLSSRDDLPPVEYLDKLQHTWGRFLKGAQRGTEKTPDDVKREAWDQLLDSYGYGQTSSFDTEIARCVKRGFIDRAALEAEAKSLSAQFADSELRGAHESVIRRFWSALNEDGAGVLRELEEVTRRAVAVISLGDMMVTYDVFASCGRQELADELAQRYIEANQHRPGIFENAAGTFRDHYTGPFAELARREAARHVTVPTIEEALDRIRPREGWNREDIAQVAAATPDQVEQVLRAADGPQFRRRVEVLLALEKMAEGAESAKAVSKATLDLLRRWAAADPVAAVRLRRFLPPAEAS